jgi:hypothetical protein
LLFDQAVIVGLGALSADRGKATKLIQELLEIPAHTNLSLILACEINDISSLQVIISSLHSRFERLHLI